MAGDANYDTISVKMIYQELVEFLTRNYFWQNMDTHPL